MQPHNSGSKRGAHLVPYHWKKGQSGNPKGSPKGTRRALATDFVADLYESWKTLGKPAILAMAWTDPGAYVRVVASLMPKDIEVTVTNVHLERMTTRELEQRLRETADPQDPLEAQEGPDKVFEVG